MLDCGAGTALVVGSSAFAMEHRSHGEVPPMSVGADSLVSGLVGKACGPQWTHVGARMTGPSLCTGIPSPLQVVGLDVVC